MSVLELQSMNFQDFLVETRIYDCLNVSVMFFLSFYQMLCYFYAR